MKVTTIDPVALRTVSAAFVEALGELADEYGLNISRGKSTYSANDANLGIHIEVQKTAGGKTATQDTWDQHHRMFGMDKDDLGRKFISRRRRYTVSGLSINAHKYPIVCIRDDGKEYKFAPGHVRRQLIVA